MKKIYKLMLAVTLLLSATGLEAQSYFTEYGTYGNDYGRKLNTLTFQRNSVTSLVLSINQGTTKDVSPVYFDKTTETVNVSPGDVLTVKYNWTGAWMHNIVYVDWNNDKSFTIDGSDNERLGYNGLSESSEMTKPVTYTIPVTQAFGQYRMRIMVDWLDENFQSIPNSLDRTSINMHGGSVVDIVLNVGDPKIVSLRSLIGKYKAYTTTQYPVIGTYAEPVWNSFQTALATAEAYAADEKNLTDDGITAQIDALNAAAALLDTKAALPVLLAKAKAMNSADYPLGIVMGYYSQAKWDALQAAIVATDAFVANGEPDSQVKIDTQIAALQTAIDELKASLILPFKLSDDSKTYWYQIRDKRATKSYWQIGEYVNDTQNLTSALIMTQTDDNTNDAQLFKIYQAESGYYYIVSKSTDFPLSKFEDKLQTVRDSLPLEFNITRGVDISHYIISLATSGSQLNSYASYNPQYIGLYNNVNDPGNNWEFVEKIEEGQTNFADLKSLLGNALAMLQSNYPSNFYPAEKWNEFVTARTAATNLVAKEGSTPQPDQAEVDAMVTSLQQAIDNLNGSFIPQVEFSTPEKSVYYFVQDKRGTTNYWVVDGALRLGLTTVLDSVSDMHMFKFVKAGTGNAFKIYSKAYPNNALSVSPDDANLVQINEAAADTTWIMGRTPAKDELYFTVGLESTKAQLNSYVSQLFVGFWTPSSDDPGNDWKFVPVVNTAIKQVLATDLGIYVSNRRIVSKDASAKLNVFSVLGQKVNAKSELRPGVYMVQVIGKTGVAKMIVR